MRKFWGKLVYSTRQNLWAKYATIPQLFAVRREAGYKPGGFYPLNSPVLQAVFHGIFANRTPVFQPFIPTIHNTYKNKNNLNKLFVIDE